jgi:hypothetical protein
MTEARIHMFVPFNTELLELCNRQDLWCNVVKFAADVILAKYNDEYYGACKPVRWLKYS